MAWAITYLLLPALACIVYIQQMSHTVLYYLHKPQRRTHYSMLAVTLQPQESLCLLFHAVSLSALCVYSTLPFKNA